MSLSHELPFELFSFLDYMMIQYVYHHRSDKWIPDTIRDWTRLDGTHRPFRVDPR